MTRRKLCERCCKPEAMCYCPLLPALDNRWPVHILQHPQEARHAIGTARIAHLGLRHCTLHECALAPAESTESSTVLTPGTVLIYPGAHSQPLSLLKGTPPHPLLFIDATWRKSRRFLFESPALAALPRYAIESPPPGRYRIRKAPFPEALSTLEAIVHTLAFLEDDHERYLPLLQVMDAVIAQQIDRMGRGTFRTNHRG